MTLKTTCAIIVSIFLTKTSVCDAATIQAAIDLDKGIDGMLDMLMGSFDLQQNEQLTRKKAADLTTALKILAPLLTIRGNITDSSRSFTLSFNFEAAPGVDQKQSRELIANPSEEDDHYEITNWRSTGGIFHPIVQTIEPYVVEALNLIFSGILSTIIGNFLESASMLHEAHLL